MDNDRDDLTFTTLGGAAGALYFGFGGGGT